MNPIFRKKLIRLINRYVVLSRPSTDEFIIFKRANKEIEIENLIENELEAVRVETSMNLIKKYELEPIIKEIKGLTPSLKFRPKK